MSVGLLHLPVATGDGSSLTIADYVLGAALFDTDGLLISCAHRGLGRHLEWVQTTFNALCLQSLLAHSLQLKTVQHLLIRGSLCNILLVRQRQRYLGILLDKTTPVSVTQSIVRRYRLS